MASEVALWKRQTALTALILLAITILVSRTRMVFYPLYQVQSQDLLPLIVLSVSLFANAFWTLAWRLPERLPKMGYLCIAGLTITGLLWFGTYALMGNFPLSGDERMVVFDMAVFDGRHFATPLAEFWRPYARALVPGFLLNESMPTGLVSSYLPLNSLLRLAFSKLADPALFNPLLALAGGVALLDIARRIFPDDGPVCCVVLLVYTLSAQMLASAMTVYSMTAHMALNLIWLAAFLHGGRRAHSAAIVTGFVATGLHQVIFHPFFVAPFLLWRLRDRQWRLVLLYAAAYAAIMLWWIYYPVLAAHAVASTAEQAPNSNFLVRISSTLREPDAETVITMFLNLLRFAAWQNFALLPLLSAAVGVAIRDRGLSSVLLLGIGLWVAFIALVIPFQGHGTGFRYLHPYLGSFALLAGYGYRELRAGIGRRADSLVLSLSGVTAMAAIPLSFIATYTFLEPHIALDRLIAMQRTPMVLVDTDPGVTADGQWTSNAVEDVRNLPDLSNRPLRFASVFMTPDLLAGLCRHGQVTLITRADERRAGFRLEVPADSARFEQLVRPVQQKMPQCFAGAAGAPSVPNFPLDKQGA